MCAAGIGQFGVVIWREVYIVLKLDLAEQKPVMDRNKIIYVSIIVSRYWILFGISKQILIYVLIYFHWLCGCQNVF